MVDEQQPDRGRSAQASAPGRDNKPDADWGEDWESAFQAEEFLIDDKGGSETGSYDFSPAEAGGFGDLPDFDGEEEPTSVGGESVPVETDAAASSTGGKSPGLMARFSSLPLPARLGIPAALILLLAIGLLLPLLRTTPPPLTEPAPMATMANPSTVEEPDQTAPAESPAAATTPDVSPQAILPPLELEKKRTKWPFAPFFIPAEDPESKEIVFVTVELSLVTLVDEGDNLPLSQKPLVRDMIFQFFVNRPLYDLRRYSLARGEMNQQLLGWLARQWPDGQLEAIVFHKYELS